MAVVLLDWLNWLHSLSLKGGLLVILQGFIQALLLASVFREGLSFTSLGHNLCVSILTFASGDSVLAPCDFKIEFGPPAKEGQSVLE